MHKLLTHLIDLVYPPREQEKLIREASKTSDKHLFSLVESQNFSSLSHYSEPLIHAAIIENKFHHNSEAAKILGKLLNKWYLKQSESLLVVPIPLGNKRLRERGHNQVETIIKAAEIKNTLQILKRIQNTTPQSSLSKVERLQNVTKAFAFNDIKIDWLQYSHVVIVDDVVTTGATLAAAKSTLVSHLPSHIKVTCLAIAH